ncbi:MAG: hypothetical protein ABW133_00440, partial [Polyangiaceae bacterium]
LSSIHFAKEEAMATLALRPVLPLHPRSSGTKRPAHHARNPSRRRVWQTAVIVAGAIGLSAFSIVAPILDDPSDHLAALDMTPTIALVPTIRTSDDAFELTPTMLGPAISEEALAFLGIEEWLEMPELQVHALPPDALIEATDG